MTEVNSFGELVLNSFIFQLLLEKLLFNLEINKKIDYSLDDRIAASVTPPALYRMRLPIIMQAIIGGQSTKYTRNYETNISFLKEYLLFMFISNGWERMFSNISK